MDADITRISVSNISGHGQQKKIEFFRGEALTPSLIPKYRIEIAVNEEFVKKTCDTIIKAAKSNKNSNNGGEIGDGKIFILPLDNCIRIRTGEEGEDAI